MARVSKISKELRERLQEIDDRLRALESLQRPLVWVIGKPVEHVQQVDTHAPSAMEH